MPRSQSPEGQSTPNHRNRLRRASAIAVATAALIGAGAGCSYLPDGDERDRVTIVGEEEEKCGVPADIVDEYNWLNSTDEEQKEMSERDQERAREMVKAVVA